MQKGTIFQKGQAWILSYRDIEGKQRNVKLADVDSRFPRLREVEEAGLADQYLNPVNAATQSRSKAQVAGAPAGNPTQRLAHFIEHEYFPKIEKKASTLNGYRHIFEKHLKNRIGDVRLLDCETSWGTRLMRQIAKEEPHLSHITLTHIKNFLVAVFTYARQEGVLKVAENPMRDVPTPPGNQDVKPNTYVYSLAEVAAILDALDGLEPARTVTAVAAFSGLRKSELRGLRWGDLRDGHLYVERSFWKSSLEEKPKSAPSRAGVPVIDQLAEILESHRNGYADSDFIFAGPKLGRPLDLKNLANRIIIPALKKKKIKWHGWHAFRRGLGTNLDHLNVKDSLIQLILRHADVATTKKHYIKPASPDVRAAMGKLSKVLKAMAKA